MIVGLTVRDNDVVIDRVNGQVVAIGDGVTDPVIDLLNGCVVAIGEPLLVREFERVKLTDVVREMVPEGVPVGRSDGGIVTAGDGVIVRDFVRVTDTVGLIDRVNG